MSSETKLYEHKLRNLETWAKLQAELEKSDEQTKSATGEYGYWGGVAKREMVEAEMKRRKLPHTQITEQAVAEWCQGTMSDFTKSRLLDLLTGKLLLEEAREDVLSFMPEQPTQSPKEETNG